MSSEPRATESSPATALALLLKRLREPLKYSEADLGKFCVEMRDALHVELLECEQELFDAKQEATEQRNLAASYLAERDDLASELLPSETREKIIEECASWLQEQLFDPTSAYRVEQGNTLAGRMRLALKNAAPQIRPQDGEEAVAGFGNGKPAAHEVPERDSAAAAPSLPSAGTCSVCGAAEGEPCRGNCERRTPSAVAGKTPRTDAAQDARFKQKTAFPDPVVVECANLEHALQAIKALKPESIGDTGFATGPLALFNAAQRIAKDALKGKLSAPSATRLTSHKAIDIIADVFERNQHQGAAAQMRDYKGLMQDFAIIPTDRGSQDQ